MPTSPQEMMAAMLANLAEKTGRAAPAWDKLIKASGLEKHGQITKWLKTEHGLTHGYANMLALRAVGTYADKSEGDLVDAQFAGAKAGLRPIYDRIVDVCSTFGKDVEIAPRKTQVTLRGPKRVFAIVKAATKTRVDLGLRLDDEPQADRLGAPGAFGGMATHKVALTSVKDVDKQLQGWLKRAYAAS